MTKENKICEGLNALTDLIRKLRAPDGCPWDKKQKQEDIGKYILEEAWEVVESLESGDQRAIAEELGDLLFQILFLAEIGQENNAYSLEQIMEGIRGKMIRRHPHIFGDIKVSTVEEVKENWQQIKKKERSEKSAGENIFASIPRALPALKRAQKITAAAAVYGFDWPATPDVMEKLQEEFCEFNTALTSNNHSKIEEEMGDVLFTLVNLSRFIRVDPEAALVKATNKFLQRFAFITDQLASQGKTLEQTTLKEMNELWEKAKTDRI